MHAFQGDLLIGGMRMKHVRGEIQEERCSGNSADYVLSGRLHLSPDQLKSLQLNREYRIQLEDGRGGQVVLSRIAREQEHEFLADFVPPPRAAVAATAAH